jgi:putative ABC transport system permease protein
MGFLLRDLRHGMRTLLKDPGFTAVALLSLALGIGANTALFQLLDAVRLRSVPIEDPDRLALVDLSDHTGRRGSTMTAYPALSNPIWERLRDRQDAFAGVVAWANTGFDLGPEGETHEARGLFVSGDFFRVLGVRPVLGRVFEASDDRRGCGLPGVVVSHAFWQRELGADPAIIGKSVRFGRHALEVLGVTPEAFTGLEVGRSYDVAMPICSQAALWSDGNWLDEGTVWWLTVAGRLGPGATIEGAKTRLRALSPALFEATLPSDYPAANVKDYLGFRLTAAPAATGVSWLRSQYADPLAFLLATSGIVLLITCANLANLMLARAAGRQHEMAIRLAIGASRAGLVRQMMAEGLLLAVGGGGLGVLLAGYLSQLLIGLLATEGRTLFLDLEPNRAVLGFALAASTVTCLLFGLVPALRASKLAPGDAMKAGGRGTTAGREALGLRRALVVSQVAFSLVLVVGAVLFSRTLGNVLAVDAGFKPAGVVIASVDLSRASESASGRAGLKVEILERIRAATGVTAAAEVAIVPLSDGSTSNRVWPGGSDAARAVDANFNWVGPDYLRTMAMTLLAGRDFDNRDDKGAPRVAIVNPTFARRLGLGTDAIGKTFRREATPSEPERVFEIVGMVSDTKYKSLREDFVPLAFLPMAQGQQPDFYAQLVVRSKAPLGEIATRLRSTIAEVNPTIGTDFRALETTVRDGLLRERLMATLSTFFGLLASLISALGLYGVMSYTVVRRTHEIGIRVALGADRGRVVSLVLGEASKLLAIGLAFGMPMAFLAGSTAESLLYGLKPNDFTTFAFAAVLLAVVTGAASYLPSRRASSLDPMTALREE